jgi:hypothetical protein
MTIHRKSLIAYRVSRIANRRWLSFAICPFVICSLLVSPTAAQTPPPDRRFGAVEAFWDSASAIEAGVGWERMMFEWSQLQPNNADDWNSGYVQERETWTAWANAAGREVVGLLIKTPAWATDGLPECGVPRGLALPVDDPGNLWAAFVRRIVGTFAGQIDRWIIWNEPDIVPGTFGVVWCGSMEEYYQLLKVAYLAAHEANPNVTIHLAGLTFHHDRTYLDRLLTIATQDPAGSEHGYYFDVVTLHIYFQTETVRSIVNEARATLSAHGLDKSIWINETNAPSNADPPYWVLPGANFDITLEEQAGFLLQSFALALSLGVERIAVYRWVDNEPRPGEEPFGVIRSDHSRRPAYDAYRLITAHYAGATSAREERHTLYIVVTLGRGDRTTRVLWARTQAGATVSLPAEAAQARLITQSGTEQVVEPVGGRYTLTLPGARCPPVPPANPISHPACIIGGPTYLLVEETGSPPLSTDTTPPPTPESPTATVAGPTETPTPIPEVEVPLPTAAPTPTDIPTEAPTLTPTPTETPTDVPSPTSTWLPTATPSTGVQLNAPPLPPAPTAPEEPVWPMLTVLAVVMLFAVFIGTLFKRQGW